MSTFKILVAPLDWGLGHATRCIPIINELVRQDCTVWIAAGGSSLHVIHELTDRRVGLDLIPANGNAPPVMRAAA